MSDKIYTTVPVTIMDRDFEVRLRIPREKIVAAVAVLEDSGEEQCFAIWADSINEVTS